jgi:hypothetical protein
MPELKVVDEKELELIDKKVDARIKIFMFQEILSRVPGAWKGDNDYCPLKHTFADGIYVREIFIPKDTVLVGKIHKHSHPNFLMKGKVSVFTETGGIEHLEGPLSIISPAGTKRVVYAHEDTIWITVHLNEKNTTNLDELEEEIIAKSYEEFLGIDMTKTKELEEL